MPKTKLQNIIFTIIMAVIMVYGMIVYNVALNTGGVSNATFLLALHELPIMAPMPFSWSSSWWSVWPPDWPFPSCGPLTAPSSSPTPSPP